MNKTPFAVFVVLDTGVGIAATTRDDGTTALPGGKVNLGEFPLDAVKREAYEEGWDLLGVYPIPAYEAVVYGRIVQWFLAVDGDPLDDYKEKHRGIRPVLAAAEDLQSFGNNKAIPACLSADPVDLNDYSTADMML